MRKSPPVRCKRAFVASRRDGEPVTLGVPLPPAGRESRTADQATCTTTHSPRLVKKEDTHGLKQPPIQRPPRPHCQRSRLHQSKGAVRKREAQVSTDTAANVSSMLARTGQKSRLVCRDLIVLARMCMSCGKRRETGVGWGREGR
jgi:hypothetical protein